MEVCAQRAWETLYQCAGGSKVILRSVWPKGRGREGQGQRDRELGGTGSSREGVASATEQAMCV